MLKCDLCGRLKCLDELLGVRDGDKTWIECVGCMSDKNIEVLKKQRIEEKQWDKIEAQYAPEYLGWYRDEGDKD